MHEEREVMPQPDSNITSSLKREAGLLRLALELYLEEDLNIPEKESSNLKDIRNSARKITRLVDVLLKD